MPGINIGDGAIIGARSVVTKDVDPYSIVVGNPAIEVRKRFNPEVIELLLDLKWWNWSIEEISTHANTLLSNDAENLKFLRKL